MKSKLDLNLLKDLMLIPSPSGYTAQAISFLETFCKDLGYQTSLNKKGNLIVSIKGKSDYTVGIASHIDTLGFMVKSIRSDGHLSFVPVGGAILPTYDGEYVSIYTRDKKCYSGTILSTSPSSHVYPDATTKARTIDNMYIRLDEMVKSKQDTINLGIACGDFICADVKFDVTSSGFIKSRYLDDKASVFIVLEILKYLKKENIVPKHNLEIIFSTYEEVGHGGASIPKMDELLVVDMGCVGADLSCTEEMVSICAKDSSGPYDYFLISSLINLAKENNIDYAVDIYPMYGSDGSAALRAGNDIKCALIGSGIQASHGMERTHIKGLENTFNLILAYIK